MLTLPEKLKSVILTQAERPYTTFDSDASRKLVGMIDWTKCSYKPSEAYRSPYYPPTGISTDLFDRVCSAEGFAGDIEILDWIRKNIADLSQEVWLGSSAGGHLGVFDWVVQRNGTPMHDYTGVVAAYHGKRDVLEWMHECDYDYRGQDKRSVIYSLCWKVCAAAAMGGHLDFVKWAHADGYVYGGLASAAAAGAGHLDILKWARDSGLPIDWMSTAASRHRDDVHEWLTETGYTSEGDIPWECFTPLDVLHAGLTDV